MVASHIIVRGARWSSNFNNNTHLYSTIDLFLEEVMAKKSKKTQKNVPALRPETDKQTLEKLSNSFKGLPNSLRMELLRQLVAANPARPGASDAEVDQNLEMLLAMLVGVDPEDAVEVNLAVQMVSTHNTMMHLLAQANAPGQSFRYQEFCLRTFEKLSKLFLRQIDALDKHRGKGRHQVSVGSVHVADGGQALVGNVDTGGRRAASQPDDRPKAIENKPGETIDGDRDVAVARSHKRRKAA